MKLLKKWIPFLLCLCIILPGCRKAPQIGALDDAAWDTKPTVTFGELESEQLKVEQWNSGRGAETSGFKLCEGENGYYTFNSVQGLMYADKDALDQWVMVCNRPDCDHLGSDCSAYIKAGSFLGKNGRIYYAADLSNHPELFSGMKYGSAIYSMAPDGTDLRVEYIVQEETMNNGGFSAAHLFSNYCLSFANKLDEHGQGTVQLFRTDENGTKLLWEETDSEGNATFVSHSALMAMYGETLFYSDAVSEAGYYNFGQEQPVRVDIPNVPVLGSYLAGSTIRFFSPNKGYYDRDLNTEEEAFLAGPRIENSLAAIMLPNLIVESTLLYTRSVMGRTAGMEHSMEVFDGQQWHTVQLPQSLQFADKDVFLAPLCVTSDAIWFTQTESVVETTDNTRYQYTDMHLYRILIGADLWTLKYIGTMQQPRNAFTEVQ